MGHLISPLDFTVEETYEVLDFAAGNDAFTLVNDPIKAVENADVVITDTWNIGLEGVAVTTVAFQRGLPLPDEVCSFILMLCLIFFAFTTILGWDYYSERCLEYLCHGNQKVVHVYRWIYILAVLIGPFMTISAVWTIADIFNGLMALPNLVALIALSGVIVAETKSYFERVPKYK